MFSKSFLQDVLNTLDHMLVWYELGCPEDDGFHENQGIYENLSKITDIYGLDGCDVVGAYISGWYKFSGDATFPVPSPDDYELPYRAYGYLALWEGEYGALRVELLEFLIKEISKELDLVK